MKHRPSNIKSIPHTFLSTMDNTKIQELPLLPKEFKRMKGERILKKINIRNKIYQQNTFTAKSRLGELLPRTRLKIRNSSLNYNVAIEGQYSKVNPIIKKPTFHSVDHSPTPRKEEKQDITIQQLLQQINVKLKINNILPNLKHLKLTPLQHVDTTSNILKRTSIPQGKECQLINLELVSQYSPKTRTQRNKDFKCEQDNIKIDNQAMGYNVTFGPKQFRNAVSNFSNDNVKG